MTLTKKVARLFIRPALRVMKLTDKQIQDLAWERYKPGQDGYGPAKIAKDLIKEYELDISFTTLRNRINMQFKRRRENPALYEWAAKMGVDPDLVKRMWISKNGKKASFEVSIKEPQQEMEHQLENILESIKEYAPKKRPKKRRIPKEPHLLVVDIADLHVSKYSRGQGDDYDTQTAVKRALEGVEGILNKTAGFEVDKIICVLGNDILHHDGNGTTTKGTPQEFDLSWDEAFEAARKLYVDVIDTLLTIAPVHCIHCMDNHGYYSSYFLAQVIKAFYHNTKEVTFDVGVKHRKYTTYGSSLMMFTHGDKARFSKLPQLLTYEAKKEWAEAKHSYIYTHHTHHKQVAKDYVGVTVESLRSASGTDTYHQENGFIGSPKAIEAFVHSKEGGQIARISHIF